MNILLGIFLALLVLLAVNVQKSYASTPPRELKRRARSGDETANLLYRAVAYGHSLNTVLWFMVGLFSAGFFVFVSRHSPVWFALIASTLLVWGSFIRSNNGDVNRYSLRIAARLAPALAWILKYVHPLFDKLISSINKYRPFRVHTGLYDKQDLLDLLNDQNIQPDNRIEQYELELAFHALTFGDKLVGEFLTPRRVVKVVSADDSIGPVMMSELHESGFSRFPVYEGRKDNMVGTLFLRDLIKTKTTGKVREVMRREVTYIHEDQSLYDGLVAILKTRHHLLTVVNSFEEYVGVITIEDILEQVIGRPILDEFDQYDDLRAVAARSAKKEHKEHKEVPATSTPTEDQTSPSQTPET